MIAAMSHFTCTETLSCYALSTLMAHPLPPQRRRKGLLERTARGFWRNHGSVGFSSHQLPRFPPTYHPGEPTGFNEYFKRAGSASVINVPGNPLLQTKWLKVAILDSHSGWKGSDNVLDLAFKHLLLVLCKQACQLTATEWCNVSLLLVPCDGTCTTMHTDACLERRFGTKMNRKQRQPGRASLPAAAPEYY